MTTCLGIEDTVGQAENVGGHLQLEDGDQGIKQHGVVSTGLGRGNILGTTLEWFPIILTHRLDPLPKDNAVHDKESLSSKRTEGVKERLLEAKKQACQTPLKHPSLLGNQQKHLLELCWKGLLPGMVPSACIDENANGKLQFSVTVWWPVGVSGHPAGWIQQSWLLGRVTLGPKSPVRTGLMFLEGNLPTFPIHCIQSLHTFPAGKHCCIFSASCMLSHAFNAGLHYTLPPAGSQQSNEHLVLKKAMIKGTLI